MSDADIKWVATLSDGSTAVEHVGEYKIIPGEKKPWVRLVRFAGENGLHLTSLRLNSRGRTIHMPRSAFDKFGAVGEKSSDPLFYSLNYIIEGTIDANGGTLKQENFIDLIAHYPKFDLHYIQDIDKGNTSWLAVTEGYVPNAPSPLPKENKWPMA